MRYYRPGANPPEWSMTLMIVSLLVGLIAVVAMVVLFILDLTS